MLIQISAVEEVEFEIEVALEEQRGIQPLPFPKMDSKLHTVYNQPIQPYSIAYCSSNVNRTFKL